MNQVKTSFSSDPQEIESNDLATPAVACERVMNSVAVSLTSCSGMELGTQDGMHHKAMMMYSISPQAK